MVYMPIDNLFFHFIAAVRLQATALLQEEAGSAEKQRAPKKQKQQSNLPKAKPRPRLLQAGQVPSAHPLSTKDAMPPSTPSFQKAPEKPSKPELMKPADAIPQQKPGTYIPNLNLNSVLIMGQSTAIPANRLPTAFGTPDLTMLPPPKAPRRPNPFAKKKEGGK